MFTINIHAKRVVYGERAKQKQTTKTRGAKLDNGNHYVGTKGRYKSGVSPMATVSKTPTFDKVVKCANFEDDTIHSVIKAVKAMLNAKDKGGAVYKGTTRKALRKFYGMPYKEVDAYLPMNVIMQLHIKIVDSRTGKKVIIAQKTLDKIKYNFVKGKVHRSTYAQIKVLFADLTVKAVD